MIHGLLGHSILGGAVLAGGPRIPRDVLPGNYYITVDGRLLIQGNSEADMIETIQFYHRQDNIKGNRGVQFRLYIPDGRLRAVYGPDPGKQMHMARRRVFAAT